MAIGMTRAMMATDNTEDRALLRRIAAGDRDSVALVYDRYATGIFQVLTAILGSTADAEDALQETFCKLIAGRMAGANNLKAYLYTVARREAYQILRSRKRVSLHDDGGLPEAGAVSAEIAGVDWQALLRDLPVEQREVVAMKVYEEMTFEEIASLTGVSVNTAASRYRYGIARLRAGLREDDGHGS